MFPFKWSLRIYVALIFMMTLGRAITCFAEDYGIFDLGPDSQDGSVGYHWDAVNDEGDVVGSYFDGTDSTPVVWRDEEVSTVTQTQISKSYLISGDGSVAGSIETSDLQNKVAAVWKREVTGYTELTFPGLNALHGTTRWMSSNGTIVGDRYVSGSQNPDYEIFVASPPSYNAVSVFNDRAFQASTSIATIYPTRVLVNDAGTVVLSHNHGTIELKSNSYRILEDIFPLHLNNNGDILGNITDTSSLNSDAIPVVLRADGSYLTLNPPTGFEAKATKALDMNDDGTVVGVAQTDEDTLPIVWKNGQPSDGNALIPVGSGWTYILPLRISNSGNMIGQGVLNGIVRWFLLKKVDDCSTSSSRVYALASSPNCDLGVTWEMPSKEADFGIAWQTADGVIPKSNVNPTSYTVTLIATLKGKEIQTCPSDKVYKWSIQPALKPTSGKAPKPIKIGNSCRETIQAPDEGKYFVTIEELNKSDNKPTGKKAVNQEVVVQDWLIVAMGDSNGSGQGTAQDGIPYEFLQCDRNHHSYQAQLAKLIEDADRKTSVTLIHTSCSGARTVHIASEKYLGQNPNLNNKLSPQAAQVLARLKGAGKAPREVDAVILSIGVNDILFGPMLSVCIPGSFSPFYPGCEYMSVEIKKDAYGDIGLKTSSGKKSAPMEEMILKRLRLLPKLFKPVISGIYSLGVKPANIFHTTYPDFTKDQNGEFCSGAEGALAGFYTEDWRWLGEMRAILSAQIYANGARKNWGAVPDFKFNFHKHGYCATPDSWIQSIIGSAIDQGTKNGGFHSILAGHTSMASSLFPEVCKTLYGNESCTGRPRTPRVCNNKNGGVVCK